MHALNLLGKPQVIAAGEVLKIRSIRIYVLLAFIYSEKRLVTRKELYQSLWFSDNKEEKDEVFAGRLRVLIYSMRNYSHYFLTVESKGLSFTDAGFADISKFEALSEDKDIEKSKKLIELYKGGFLEGVSLPAGNLEFNNWLELQRNHYQHHVLEALDRVINHLLTGRRRTDLDDVFYYIQKSKDINPWRSNLHIQIATIYIKEKKPEQAIKHLENFITEIKDKPSIAVSDELLDLLYRLKVLSSSLKE